MGGVGGHMLLCCWCGRLVAYFFFFFFFDWFSSNIRKKIQEDDRTVWTKNIKDVQPSVHERGCRILFGAMDEEKTHDKGGERKQIFRETGMTGYRKKKEKKIYSRPLLLLIFFFFK